MDNINPFAPHAWVSSIDWSRPWLASVARIGQPMVAQIAQGLPVHAALNQYLPAALQEAGLRFVPQEALPDGVAYETFIREQLKLHLNQLQAQAIARDGVGQRRGPLRDAITVLDENGAIWLAPQPLVEALRARQWQRLMVELRPLWAQSCLWPVGHALLEKLVQPRKPMTAHVLCLPWTPDTAAALQASGDAVSSALDAHVARDMLVCADVLATKPFSPLPVLGVPGWWPQNEELSFYDDPLVFRAARPTT